MSIAHFVQGRALRRYEVVRHDRIGIDIDSKKGGNEAHSVDYPLSTVLIVFAAVCINATEKRSPHTTGDDMVVRGVLKADEFFSGAWHRRVLLTIGEMSRSYH